jgi:hypothetical protein
MTAVEWLMEQITYDNGFGERRNSYTDSFDLTEFFEKAKEMQKKDMLHFGAKCCIMTTQKNHWTLEKIYEETFNKNE